MVKLCRGGEAATLDALGSGLPPHQALWSLLFHCSGCDSILALVSEAGELRAHSEESRAFGLCLNGGVWAVTQRDVVFLGVIPSPFLGCCRFWRGVGRVRAWGKWGCWCDVLGRRDRRWEDRRGQSSSLPALHLECSLICVFSFMMPLSSGRIGI